MQNVPARSCRFSLMLGLAICLFMVGVQANDQLIQAAKNPNRKAMPTGYNYAAVARGSLETVAIGSTSQPITLLRRHSVQSLDLGGRSVSLAQYGTCVGRHGPVCARPESGRGDEASLAYQLG